MKKFNVIDQAGNLVTTFDATCMVVDGNVVTFQRVWLDEGTTSREVVGVHYLMLGHSVALEEEKGKEAA